MNIHVLTSTEASYLLFSIKKTLRDRQGLTPEMEQFYESTAEQLSAKLNRLQGRVDPKERSRDAFVRASWAPESLAKISEDLAGNS